MSAVDEAVLAQAFMQARTFNRFQPRPVEDATLRRIYDVAKWGPTSANSQPARFVFLRTEAAKRRLEPALAAGNVAKTMAAPVVVIVAIDTRFYEHLPGQFTAFDAHALFSGNAALATTTALRNGTLQGAYFIVAARLLGLDCGPMSGFDAAAVDAEFFADGRWKSNFLINLGYGDPAGNHPRGPRLPFEDAALLL